MGRLSLDEYFLNMLKLVAARSTCPRRAVGAIVTDEHGVILGTGYNGTPRGITHCGEVYESIEGSQVLSSCKAASDPRGDTSRCWAAHAEVNALLQCGANLPRVHTLYITCSPCFSCAKYIVNAGVQRVVTTQLYAGEHPEASGINVLNAAGIRLEKL